MTDTGASAAAQGGQSDFSFGGTLIAVFTPAYGHFGHTVLQCLIYTILTLALWAGLGSVIASAVIGVMTSDPNWMGWEDIEYYFETIEPASLGAIVGAASFGVLALVLISFFIQGSFFGAVLRQQLRPDALSGLFGVRFGVEALRLALLYFLVSVIITLLAIVVYIAGILPFMGFAAELGLAANVGFALTGGAILVLGFVWVFYVFARLAIAKALTVAEGRFQLFEAWSATKGHGWWLFGAHFVAGLIGYALNFAVSLIGMVGYVMALVSFIPLVEGLEDGSIEIESFADFMTHVPPTALVGGGLYLFGVILGTFAFNAVVVAVAGRYVRDAARSGKIAMPARMAA